MDINTAVSENVKRLRMEKQLSLDSAARMTGVSKSMLGQIERGEVNPTISVLWKIANGLKVSFTTLVEIKAEAAQLVKADSISPLREDQGRYINHPVFSYEEGSAFETYRIEILPGGSLEAEPHLAGCEEYLTVYAGAVEVTAGGERYLLDTGDSLRFRADCVHGYRNVGDTVAWMNMIIHYER